MAIFFALLAFAGWGVGDIFGALSSRKIGYVYTFFWLLIFSFIVISFYIPFAGPLASLPMFGFAFLLNCLDLYGTMIYFKALEIGNASLVGAISGPFGFISAILSIIFFGESLNAIQWVGVIFAVGGVLLSSFKLADIRHKKMRHMLSEPSIRYALFALFSWGFYYAMLRIPVNRIGWFWTQYSWHFLFIALILLGKVKKDVFGVVRNRKQLGMILLFTFFLVIGVFSYNLGISFGFTSIVAPIAGSAMVLFIVLSRFVFREHLSLQQKIGVFSSLLGIIILSFSSI